MGLPTSWIHFGWEFRLEIVWWKKCLKYIGVRFARQNNEWTCERDGLCKRTSQACVNVCVCVQLAVVHSHRMNCIGMEIRWIRDSFVSHAVRKTHCMWKGIWLYLRRPSHHRQHKYERFKWQHAATWTENINRQSGYQTFSHNKRSLLITQQPRHDQVEQHVSTVCQNSIQYNFEHRTKQMLSITAILALIIFLFAYENSQQPTMWW